MLHQLYIYIHDFIYDYIYSNHVYMIVFIIFICALKDTILYTLHYVKFIAFDIID